MKRRPRGVPRPSTAPWSGARRGLGVNDLPIIFDLPPGAALKRAQEFQNYVHPVVQTYCAKCHNDRYEGNFHLIGFKTRVERTPDTIRANLDAVLGLVDRENPAQRTTRQFAPSARRGPQHPADFRGIEQPCLPDLGRLGEQSPGPASPDRRASPPVPPRPAAAPKTSPSAGPGSTGGPWKSSRCTADRRLVGRSRIPSRSPSRRCDTRPGQGFVDDSNADPAQYPIPFAVSGVRPNLPPLDGQPAADVARPKTAKAAAPAPPNIEGLPAGALADQAAAAAIEAGEDEPVATVKKPAKKLKIDPALLQCASS